MTSENGGTAPQLDPDAQRVRDYLVGFAERRDWVDLWPRFIAERGALLLKIERVTEEQADFKPDPDVWSIREVITHLLAVSRAGMRRVEDLVAGREASSSDASPSVPDTFAELRGHLVEHSVRYTSLLERLPPSPNYSMTSPHGAFGELNSRSWFLFERVHDTDHVKQLGEVMSADGYPA